MPVERPRRPYIPNYPTSNPVPAYDNTGISFARQIPVNAAYQRLMQYGVQSDADTGAMRRNLTTNLDTSQKNRFASQLNSRTGLNDRGIMNSGIGLKRMEDLNTQYDTTDTQMTGNFDKSLADIARTKLGLSQGYSDARVQGGILTTQDQTAAQDAQLAAQDAAAAQAEQARMTAEQNANMIAAIQGQTSAIQNQEIAAPSPVVDTSYADAATAYMRALAANKARKPKPRLGQVGYQKN